MSTDPEPPVADRRMQLAKRRSVDFKLSEEFEIISRDPMQLKRGAIVCEVLHDGVITHITRGARHA